MGAPSAGCAGMQRASFAFFGSTFWELNSAAAGSMIALAHGSSFFAGLCTRNLGAISSLKQLPARLPACGFCGTLWHVPARREAASGPLDLRVPGRRCLFRASVSCAFVAASAILKHPHPSSTDSPARWLCARQRMAPGRMACSTTYLRTQQCVSRWEPVGGNPRFEIVRLG